jgi:hypothetical protein
MPSRIRFDRELLPLPLWPFDLDEGLAFVVWEGLEKLPDQVSGHGHVAPPSSVCWVSEGRIRRRKTCVTRARETPRWRATAARFSQIPESIKDW